MVKGKTKEYITKDKIIEKTVEVKRNYLSILVIYRLQITLSTERAYKDIL
jgi:hypothetical protein